MLHYTFAPLQQLLTQENNGNSQTPQEPNPNFQQQPIFTPSASNQPPEDLGFEGPDFIMEDAEQDGHEPLEPDNLNEREDESLDFSNIDVSQQLRVKTYQPAVSFAQKFDSLETKLTRYFPTSKTIDLPHFAAHSLYTVASSNL